MKRNRVIELGNIVHTGNWSSPQRGRIYSAEGVAPCCNCCGGAERKQRWWRDIKKTHQTISLNSKVNGKQPSLEDRIYHPGGAAPAITTCFFYNIIEIEYEQQETD